MHKKNDMTPEDCALLAERVACWCFYETESFEPIGEGLSYLLWAIVANDGAPFDAGVSDVNYEELLDILRRNPNNLYQDLIDMGFLLV